MTQPYSLKQAHLWSEEQLKKKKELNYIHFNKEKQNKCFSTNN